MHRSPPNGPYGVSRIATAILGVTGACFLLARSGDLFGAIRPLASLGPASSAHALAVVGLVLLAGVVAEFVRPRHRSRARAADRIAPRALVSALSS